MSGAAAAPYAAPHSAGVPDTEITEIGRVTTRP
jgi:hypothetical protein